MCLSVLVTGQYGGLTMKGIYQFLNEKEDIQSIIKGVESNLDEQLIAGVSGSGRSIITSIVQQATKKRILLITHQLLHAQQLYDELIDLLN